jgi:hypothetical protein
MSWSLFIIIPILFVIFNVIAASIKVVKEY